MNNLLNEVPVERIEEYKKYVTTNAYNEDQLRMIRKALRMGIDEESMKCLTGNIVNGKCVEDDMCHLLSNLVELKLNGKKLVSTVTTEGWEWEAVSI